MTARGKGSVFSPPALRVHVVESRIRTRKGWLRCQIGQHVKFSTELLESYCIANWEPVVYDALLVAAAVEFADKTQRRPEMSWRREFHLAIPVHEPARWKDKRVSDALRNVLDFLTGDRWHIEFSRRKKPAVAPTQHQFNLPSGLSAVIPYSDGLDSRCVAGILEQKMGDKLIRVRLGSRRNHSAHAWQPFTSVPYSVREGRRRFVESTARSRGFKFALVSGLAAYLTKADQIVVAESGQGALGPALLAVGQGYEDYRSHPLFTDRMEKFFAALLKHDVRFSFTQLWQTKAETLKRFVDECHDGPSWIDTWSCWQQNRHASVAGKKRQCGICAACLLRRVSVHAASLREPKETYVWENLSAATFEGGAATAFPKKKITRAMREYAIAGTLHLDHLADLRKPANSGVLGLCAFQLSQSLGLPEDDVRSRLDRLLAQHEREWKAFINSLGRSSFLGNWVNEARS